MFWDRVARSFEFILNLVIVEEIAQSKVIRVQSGDFHKFMERVMGDTAESQQGISNLGKNSEIWPVFRRLKLFLEVNSRCF